jgi:hypothetical protein
MPSWFDATKPADKKKKQNKGLVLKCEQCGDHCIACVKKESCQQCEKKYKLNSSFVCKPNNTMYIMLAIGVLIVVLLLLVFLIIKCCCGNKGNDKNKGTELKRRNKDEDRSSEYDDNSYGKDKHTKGRDDDYHGRPVNTTTRLKNDKRDSDSDSSDSYR